jgi:hypothetical protein
MAAKASSASEAETSAVVILSSVLSDPAAEGKEGLNRRFFY